MLSSAPVAPAACSLLLLGLIVLALVSLASFVAPEVVGLALAPSVEEALGALLVAPFDVSLPDVPAGLLEPPLVDGRSSSMSPPVVPVVVPRGEAAPVDGTQFAALAVTPAELPAAAADVSRVDGVVPVPLAPLVVFSPVKR